MRSTDLFRAAAVVLLLFLLLRAGPVSLAQSPTPTPRPKSVSSPRAPSQYFFYLPLIIGPSPALKKGVPLTYRDCPSVATMKASWEYAWVSNPPDCPGVENIPMIWDENHVNDPLSGNSEWIMGFNEPDSPNQANISPSQAAQLWRQIEQMYPARKLLAPAPTGADDTNWIVNFRNEYISAYGSPPRLDGLASHCFDWFASACISATQQFISLADSWGVPEVWVTEFSFATNAPSSPSGALQEEQTFIDWMVTQPKVTRYAWFASQILGNEWWVITCYDGSHCFNNPLIDSNSGQPTSFGNVYLPYP